MASKRNVTWKCPFCDKRFDREKLVIHVDDKHQNEIPEGFTALRYVFHYVNKRPLDYHGRCTECKGPTPWDEEVGRYKRQCGKKECHDSYVKRFEENMVKKKGYTRETSTQEGLEKMLQNRKISGKYTFQNGKKKDYVGSYEKKCLEFMDKVMNIDPDDILAPGPTLQYKYNGQIHYYITDFYYQPYNLIIEVKDGGDNPNTRNMEEYRKKQIAKEEYIIKHTDFNYIRLTNNDFGQLMSVFADLKMQLVDNSKDRVIHVNENNSLLINPVNTINNGKITDMLNKKNIIFDFGDVLTNYREEDAIKEITDIPSDAVEAIVKAFHEYWKSEKSETISFEDEMKNAKEFVPNEYKMYSDKLYCILHEYTDKYSYTDHMLLQLSKLGYNLYYLSNWSMGGWLKMIELGKFDFIKYFKGGLASWQTGTKKPDLEIYRMLLNKYELNAEECIFFDDKESNIDAARKVGIYSIKWKPGMENEVLKYAKMGVERKEGKVFNEFMNALTSGYFPGYEECDAYICTADYMQNNVFANCGQNFFAIASDPGLHNLIYVNHESVLTSSSLEEFEKTYPNVIGHTNVFALKIPMSGIHNALANYIGEILDREGMYYSVFKEHLYSIDQVRFSDKVLGEINNEINTRNTIAEMTIGTLVYNESDMLPKENGEYYNYRNGRTYVKSEINPNFFVEATSKKSKVFMEQILLGGMINNG